MNNAGQVPKRLGHASVVLERVSVVAGHHLQRHKNHRRPIGDEPTPCEAAWPSAVGRRTRLPQVLPHCPISRGFAHQKRGLPLQGHALGGPHSGGRHSASERLRQSLLGAKNLSCKGEETMFTDYVPAHPHMHTPSLFV